MSDEAIAAQPERGRFDATDRRALRAVALQFFVNGALFASVMPRLPEIRDRVEVSITTIGVLLSLAGLSGLVGSAVVGSAIARFGTRTVIIFSATMMALSVALVGVARAPGLLLVGLIGLSTFDVLVDVGMNMQGSWLSARRHAPVMNRLHGLWSLGTLIGGLTSARVAAAGVSLSTHLVVAAAVLALVVVQVGRGVLRIDEAPSAAAGTPAISTPGPGRRRAWLLPLLAIAGFFAVTMETTAIDWAAFRLRDDFGSDAGFAALGYVAVTGGMTLSRLGGDWAVARIGPRRQMELSVLLAGGGLGLAALAGARLPSLVGYVVAGAGVATLLPTLYDRAAQHHGRPGAALGALTGGLRTAGLAIPVVVGVLAATGLGVGGAIAVVTLPSAVGFLVVAGLLGPASERSG